VRVKLSTALARDSVSEDRYPIREELVERAWKKMFGDVSGGKRARK